MAEPSSRETQLAAELQAALTRVQQLERAIARAEETERILRQVKERFEQLTEHIREVFWLRTANEILYISPAYEEIWGRSCESVYRAPDSFIQAIHPADRLRVQATLQKCFERGVVSPGLEYRIIRPDDTVRWIRARSFVVSAKGAAFRIAGVAEDITERKEVEEAYRVLVEGSPLGLLILQDWRIVFANNAILEQSGYSREELLSLSSEDILDLVDPDHRATVLEVWYRCLQGPSAPIRYECGIRHHEGQFHMVEVRSSWVEYRGRSAVQANFLDVTERREAEEQHRQFEARVQQLQKLESLGLLAGGVAHELNQPVQAIQGFAQRLLRHPERPIAAFLDELQMIEGATHRMGRIVQNMRLFARAGTLELTTLDPLAPLNDALLLLRRELEADSIKVLWQEHGQALPAIRGDRVQLQQVLLNLLLNARDALRELPAEEPRRITLRTAVADRQVLLTVEDSGPGLSPGQEHHLFEPFYTTKEVGHGTGLGLAISFGIIQDHGGELRYRPGHPRGAAFTLALPIAAE